MKKNRAYKPDAQAFDEITIKTVPRYKTSELTGDQWRISATVEFLRNGVVVHSFRAGDVKTAAIMVGTEYLLAVDKAKGHFAGEGDFCDQEGCKLKATHCYRRIKKHCTTCAKEECPGLGPDYRFFCDRHSTRGDSGIDDADKNYELVRD